MSCIQPEAAAVGHYWSLSCGAEEVSACRSQHPCMAGLLEVCLRSAFWVLRENSSGSVINTLDVQTWPHQLIPGPCWKQLHSESCFCCVFLVHSSALSILSRISEIYQASRCEPLSLSGWHQMLSSEGFGIFSSYILQQAYIKSCLFLTFVTGQIDEDCRNKVKRITIKWTHC